MVPDIMVPGHMVPDKMDPDNIAPSARPVKIIPNHFRGIFFFFSCFSQVCRLRVFIFDKHL